MTAIITSIIIMIIYAIIWAIIWAIIIGMPTLGGTIILLIMLSIPIAGIVYVYWNNNLRGGNR